MKVVLTREIVRAASMDAGTANMRKHGRKVWDESDRAVAGNKMASLMRIIEPDNPTWFIEVPSC